MTSSLDDRNLECSSCLYTPCPGFVVSHFWHSYFSPRTGETITCHDYSSVNFLILSIWFVPSLFSSSLALWRRLWFAVYFPDCLCSFYLVPPAPGAPRRFACGWLHARCASLLQPSLVADNKPHFSLQKSPLKRAGFSVFWPVFSPGWRRVGACPATQTPRH